MTSRSTLEDAVSLAVSEFGRAVGPRLVGVGAPEDQLRGPLETLLATVSSTLGLNLVLHGESSLAALGVIPDYAVEVDRAMVGHLEVKAPGKGADPTRWADTTHDRRQWEKLKPLPNLVYTDGNEWSLWRNGDLVSEVVRLEGDVGHSGATLRTSGGGLARLFADFLLWAPLPPRNAEQLASSVAGLCRLLRDEVREALNRERGLLGSLRPFTEVAEDWRGLLFPDASDERFADHYAQTVTFALLLARAEGVDLSDGDVGRVAGSLSTRHGLLGRAFLVLTDAAAREHISTSLSALMRVIGVVDWSLLDGTGSRLPGLAQPDLGVAGSPWLHFYEDFLAEYDPELRKQAGAYYTPHGLVAPQVRLVDDIVRRELGRAGGLSDPGVTIVDPAMGTGSYLIEAIDHVAKDAARMGPAAAPGELAGLARRLVGFELMAGPFAVSEMLVSEALRRHGTSGSLPRLFLTDTLGDPEDDGMRLPAFLEPIGRSRRDANALKRSERVVVCVGNPPYDRHGQESGLGGWVRFGSGYLDGKRILDDFRSSHRSINQHAVNLFNLYVYFWRWAFWKVFEAHPDAPDGVVSFVTAASYTTGPGFAEMRAFMRRHADAAWIVDLSPEGHQPPVSTRPFPGVQQPLCIGFFLRRGMGDSSNPARVRYIAIEGSRRQKFERLKVLALDDPGWKECPDDWHAPFVPKSNAEWLSYPALVDLVPWGSPGVKAERTWVVAPTVEILEERWALLAAAGGRNEKNALMVSNSDRDASSTPAVLPGLGASGERMAPLADVGPGGDHEPILRFAYRSFDRQYLIADHRLLGRARPPLWAVRGDRQVFLTVTHTQPLRGGPGVTASSLLPDNDHFRGAFAGVALPLWRDAAGTQGNIAPGLLALLGERLSMHISPEDFFAYIAGVLGHSGYTTQFREELLRPGPRVPLTASQALFVEAVARGRRVLWLQTFGERYVDANDGRPAGVPSGEAQLVVAIPSEIGEMPVEASWEAGELRVGAGRISPVSEAVWRYEVSTMKVLKHWLEYRLRSPAGREGGPLDQVVVSAWPPEWNRELLELIWVLEEATRMAPDQHSLLTRIRAGEQIGEGDLTEAGVLPVASGPRRAPTSPTPAVGSPGQQGFTV